MVRLVLGGLGGPGGWVVLGTVISGFFSVPGGPPVAGQLRENNNPSGVIFQSRYECCFSKYFDFDFDAVRDRRQFAVLAQWRLRSTSCRTLSGYRQSIKKNEAFFANRLKR